MRTRTTALQMYTRQWAGTYAGKGNGDYQGELARALRAITAYLKHFALPQDMALVRLDGAYGDATVVAELLRAGISLGAPQLDEGLQAHRDAYRHAIRAFHAQGKLARTWPLRYLIRHTAYHTLDHTWEMEDKDLTAGGHLCTGYLG